MIWIVGDSNVYSKAIINVLGDETDFIECSEGQAIIKLEAYFDDDESTDKLCIITNESSVSLLERISELLYESWIPYADRLTIIVLSMPADWSSTLAPTFHDLPSSFGYRKPLVRNFDVYSIENALLDFAQRGRVRIHFVLVGELFGEHGYTFSDVFKSIYNQELVISAAHRLQSLVLIPSIHCNRFKILMKDLICGPGTFPAIIPGFDFDSNTLFNFVTELNAFINPTPPPVVPDSSTTEAVAGETGQSPAVETAPESIPIPSDPFYKLLKSMERSSISHLQHLFTAPMSSSATPLTQSMTAMMKELWREFLTYNGLQPVYVVVAGPPKSGKTEHAKSIAQSLRVPVLDLVESVIFCIQVTEDKVNCDASHFGLNAEKILAFQKELVAGVEAKLNEGKKGKDKAAAEGKIDIAAVTEAICLGISSELRKKAVGLYFSLNMVCQRRGCVWDIWEKGCVEELAQLAEVAHIFDMQEGSSAMAIPVHVIVELQCDDKWVLSKYNDYLTAQQMKPKDAQAAVKAFEATLAPYFSALQNVDEAGVLRTHPKVLSLLSDRSDITVVRAVLSAAMGNIVSAQEIQDRVRSALEGLLGRSIGWLPPIISNTSSTEHVESRPATAAAGSTTAMEEESKQTGGKHDIDPAVREKLLANTEKISLFLSNTVLPVLTRAVVEVMRDKPDDPIMYVASFLAKQSEKNQTEAHDIAREKFYELLQQGTM